MYRLFLIPIILKISKNNAGVLFHKKKSNLKLLMQLSLYFCKFILGSAVGGRVSFNSNDDHDSMDGKF